MNQLSVTCQFLDAMRKEGFEPDCKIVSDGRLHRFRDWLDKPGTRNGWYILFPDFPPAGAFGCWRRGISERWTGDRNTPSSGSAQRLKSIEQLLGKDYRKGQAIAAAMWEEATPANGRHGYLVAKGVGPHGIRYLRGALLVPLMDGNGQLHGLQRIFRDGNKRYTRFTNKRGHFFMLGSPVDNLIYIAEGFATAATIHEITGQAVAVSFDAGNLPEVAINLRAAFPDHALIVCSDNDRHIEGNPGLTKAKEAANRVEGNVVYPTFADPSSRGTDFNDLCMEEGLNSAKNNLLLIGRP